MSPERLGIRRYIWRNVAPIWLGMFLIGVLFVLAEHEDLLS